MHLEDDDSPPPPYWRTPPLVDVNLTQYASHDSMIDTPPLPPPPPLVPGKSFCSWIGFIPCVTCRGH